MMRLEQLLAQARSSDASDIHIGEEQPLVFRMQGRLTDTGIVLSSEEVRELIAQMLQQGHADAPKNGKDADFALQLADGARQRVNVYLQQGRLTAAIRLLNDRIPTLAELQLPSVLEELARRPRGLILVTGPTGSGKSTTLAAMIDGINAAYAKHILTIEDPIEYVYERKQSIIHQREVGRDTASFAEALRSALREDPDVILVGEMRDYETISAAVTAAETGHLVLSTLHTTGAARTIDRIIDVCPPEAQNQIRIQLAGVLAGVVSQALLPTADGRGRIAATELLLGTDAALNLIRENKGHQLPNIMQSGAAAGMHTLNGDLARLVQSGQITRETALDCASDKKDLEQYLL